MENESKNSPGSITRVLSRLHLNEGQSKIFDRYFASLERLATDRLGGIRQVEDGEDIAVKTLAELFEMAHGGYLQRKNVDNRAKLFGLLKQMITRRAINEVKRQNRIKRTGGQRVFNTVDIAVNGEDTGDLLNNFENGVVKLSEVENQDLETELDEIIASISNRFEGRTRTIVSLRLLGMSNRQIADEMGVSTRTIDREIESKVKPILQFE